MARFILATQTFVDMARSNTSSVRVWLTKARVERGVSDIDLTISVMSLVTLERDFQDLERRQLLGAQKLALRQRCNTLTQEFRYREGILPFTDEEMTTWAQVQRLDPTLDEDSYVYATAINRRLSLLTRPEPFHTQLQPLGLITEDPYVP